MDKPFEFDVGEEVMLMPLPCQYWRAGKIGSFKIAARKRDDNWPGIVNRYQLVNCYQLANVRTGYVHVGWFSEPRFARDVLHQLMHVMRKGGDSCG